MQRGVSRCVMDISGQSSGTDHIRTRSAEVCQLLKRPLEDQSNCVCSTLMYLFSPPPRYCKERSITCWNFSLKSLLCKNNQLPCVQSMSVITTHGNSFHPFEHSTPFLSPSEEKVKWPHMSQSVTSMLSGGWCMRAEIASAETADHTRTHRCTQTQDWWMTQVFGPELGLTAREQMNSCRGPRRRPAGDDLQLQQLDVFIACSLVSYYKTHSGLFQLFS